MISRRRNRLFIALVLLLSLLSMQFAVAAYACPGKTARVARMADMAQAGMPCAQSMVQAMDNAQTSLCHAHCQAEHQSADRHQVPALPAPTHLATSFSPPRVIAVTPGTTVQASLLARTTAPPLAVRHCCFRI